MYKMVGQEIKSSHSNALLKLLPWSMAKDKVKQQAYLKGTMNYRKVGSQRRYQLLECCGHFLH